MAKRWDGSLVAVVKLGRGGGLGKQYELFFILHICFLLNINIEKRDQFI